MKTKSLLNHWLVEVVTQEGDHEYRTYSHTEGHDYADALDNANRVVASGAFDFEDGLTISKVYEVINITQEEYETLKKVGVLH